MTKRLAEELQVCVLQSVKHHLTSSNLSRAQGGGEGRGGKGREEKGREGKEGKGRGERGERRGEERRGEGRGGEETREGKGREGKGRGERRGEERRGEGRRQELVLLRNKGLSLSDSLTVSTVKVLHVISTHCCVPLDRLIVSQGYYSCL